MTKAPDTNNQALKQPLTTQQQTWLEEQVQAGTIPSVEDGIRAAVGDMMNIARDDMSWARHYVDTARKSVSEGRSTSAETFLEKLNNRLSNIPSV